MLPNHCNNVSATTVNKSDFPLSAPPIYSRVLIASVCIVSHLTGATNSTRMQTRRKTNVASLPVTKLLVVPVFSLSPVHADRTYDLKKQHPRWNIGKIKARLLTSTYKTRVKRVNLVHVARDSTLPIHYADTVHTHACVRWHCKIPI